jgi:predicted  nucleic acid-binding Zn-ribbon protein
MSQVDELQARITAALDRITRGLEAREDGPGPEEIAQLRQQLDAATAARARLDDENAALRETVQAREAALAAAEQANGDSLRQLDTDLQALRAANERLRDTNKALREAHATGVAEPQLINSALEAELDGLRATRAADRAEVEAVLAQLARVIDAPGGESKPETEKV